MSVSIDQEQERINVLRRYQILDTPPDGAFDRITELAAQLLKVPIAVASLVDTDRIWFKSRHGLDVDQLERQPGLCASVIMNNAPYILNDASLDPRSLSHPLVAGEAGFRFYAGVPLTTHDGFNLGVLCVIDLEPRTITGDELKILQNLAQVVMDQMELRLASRHIDELYKEKSDLLSVLSHEIRTPMNGVMGMASLLQATEMTVEQKDYVDIIETCGESLITLLDHILDYSKLQAGKMALDTGPIDIRSCVGQVLQLFSAEIITKGIQLHCEIDPGLPVEFTGDHLKIRQILINLVANAVKFTKSGAIHVGVHLNAIDHSTGAASLSFMVKDTGLGIAQHKVDRLFHTYTQVHSKLYQEHFKGTGLGLSICKQLVELMGGRIWLAESTLGKGSTFRFELALLFQVTGENEKVGDKRHIG
jgi:signal transduction histidine kinase